MINEIKALEVQLKQILYGCVEHVNATKAALYLSATTDLSEKCYELVTSYAFNDASRKTLNAADDLVDRLAVKRSAFFVNGLSADMRLSEMLFRQGTDRLLAAPMFAQGRLLGFIDMRDKAGKKPFGNPDLDAARKIADEVVSLLTSRKLFGLGPIPLSAADAPRVKSQPAMVIEEHYDLSAPAVKAIEAAREVMTKRQLAPIGAPAKRMVSESHVEIIRLLLPAALAIPGAVMACFSAIGAEDTPQSIMSIGAVTDEAVQMLEDHLQAWFKGIAHKEFDVRTSRPELLYPFGAQIVPVSPAGITTILSAPVNPQTFDGLVLTVAFDRIPEAEAQHALGVFLRQIEHSIETVMVIGGTRSDRQIIAEKLLEPDFQKLPDLVAHCRQVSILSQRLANLMGLSPQQVENVRLAALLHDVGLRPLDYDRLYRRPNLTADELRGLAEHPIVGAAMVEPLLGAEVAHAILRHHERVDGKGYPSRISGNAIPVASRIIQVCDAWVAMTSAQSYRRSVAQTEAVRQIREAARTQFDEAVVARFLKSIHEIVD